MPTSTSTTLCNDALVYLGSTPVADFNDATDPVALMCRAIYPTVIDQLETAYPWSFCKKRIKLAPDSDVPAFGYAHQFTLPQDFLRVVSVSAPGGMRPEYSNEGGKLLSNAGTLYLTYMYRNTDPATWTPDFVGVARQALAYRLSFAITGSVQRQQAEYQILAQMSASAQANDSLGNRPKRLGISREIADRFTGRM